MMVNPIENIDTKYVKQIQLQKIEINFLKAQLNNVMRDHNDLCDQARAHTEGTAVVIDILMKSLRPYGFSRKRYLAAIRNIAATVPSHGPDALKHTILFDVTNKILKYKISWF